ncbi:hypothetical protein [Helicobacter burdigaliensis]|uniref:hypothetical protein n=1 Tax=Helicobacter burdigaliensis TaxID=2315334 RepID=UPI000EF6FCDE|nr:hypothetical protein [Helicobacter burdigaliensis]
MQKGAKAIVFSDDLSMLEVLKQESKTLFNQSENLYTSHDFLENLPKELRGGVYRALFENYLMSLSQTLYYSKESGFSFLSVIIGECRGVSLYEFYSKKEQYEILIDKSNKLEGIHPLQKAFSSFSAYRIAKDLKLKGKVLQSHIKEAWQFDRENLLYAMIEFSYIVEKNKKEAENFLENISKEQQEQFFKALLTYTSAKKFSNDEFFNDYFRNYGKKYPNISYVAFKLAQILGDEKISNKLFTILAINNQAYFDLTNPTMDKIGASYFIKNSLYYKLGKVIVEDSYSVVGYMKMPINISSTIVRHFLENFKIPKTKNIETYKDYEISKKLYNHPYYKLGFALIEAYKSFYKGGFKKFFAVVREIKKAYK